MTILLTAIIITLLFLILVMSLSPKQKKILSEFVKSFHSEGSSHKDQENTDNPVTQKTEQELLYERIHKENLEKAIAKFQSEVKEYFEQRDKYLDQKLEQVLAILSEENADINAAKSILDKANTVMSEENSDEQPAHYKEAERDLRESMPAQVPDQNAENEATSGIEDFMREQALSVDEILSFLPLIRKLRSHANDTKTDISLVVEQFIEGEGFFQAAEKENQEMLNKMKLTKAFEVYILQEE